MSEKKTRPIANYKVTQGRNCPNAVGTYVGNHFDWGTGREKIVRGLIPCGKWTCPVCGPRRIKNLRRRAYKGVMAMDERERGENCQKLLTLTCPGRAWRDKLILDHGDQAQLVAYDMLIEGWHKLHMSLTKKYGHFHYIRMTEPQRDGFPHFHVLLMGRSIKPMSILSDIRRLWCGLYGLGNIDIRKLDFNDVGHAINYITKYLTKDVRPVGKGRRIFSTSQGLLEVRIKKQWDNVKRWVGAVEWDLPKTSVVDLPADLEQRAYDYIRDFNMREPIRKDSYEYRKKKSDWEKAVASAKKAIAFHDLTERIGNEKGC